MAIMNLTPHEITIRTPSGGTVVVPPSGIVARVSTVEGPAQPVEANGEEIPVVTRAFGAVENLPAPSEGTAYLVSSLVLSALEGSGRRDVYAPDTGPTALRDEQGRIVAVTRLVGLG